MMTPEEHEACAPGTITGDYIKVDDEGAGPELWGMWMQLTTGKFEHFSTLTYTEGAIGKARRLASEWERKHDALRRVLLRISLGINSRDNMIRLAAEAVKL